MPSNPFLRVPVLGASCYLALAALAIPAFAADVSRHVPDATLTYHVVLTGHGSGKGRDGGTDSMSLERHFDITVRLHGEAATAAPQAPSADSALAALQHAAESCGDDRACVMRAAMGMSGARREALHHEASQMVATLGADSSWTYWPGAACHGKASVSANETYAGMDVGEGYAKRVVSNGRVAGKADIDCHEQDIDYTMTVLAHGGFELKVPAQQVDAVVTYDHGMAPDHATVRIPGITIKGGPADSPRYGRKVYPKLFTETVSPVYHATVNVPVKAQVSWTFTPDRA